jgi:hypothetical protein
MAKISPEKLAAALRANLARRKAVVQPAAPKTPKSPQNPVPPAAPKAPSGPKPA